jgi:DNA repair protein RadA/Sms
VFANAIGGVKIQRAGRRARRARRHRFIVALQAAARQAGDVRRSRPGREIRPVQRGQERLREAAKLGFTQAIVPAANEPKQKICRDGDSSTASAG